jgi:DNA-binding response OmpR family regulator
MGSYRVTNGVRDIENLSPDVYAHLMNFVGTACGATRTVVNRDLHEANLSRQDFMLLALLVSNNDRASSITQVANRIFSTEQFVRRKHISLDWRTPESDKQLLCLEDHTDEILGLPD